MTLGMFSATGKSLMSLLVHGLVSLVILVNKEFALCMQTSHALHFITFLRLSQLSLTLAFVLLFLRNLPYMQLGGIISPSIGKLSRLQRL